MKDLDNVSNLSNNESNFEHLLEKNKETAIHQRNLQVMMTKVYKILNGYAPPIKDNFLICRENTHNLRNFQIILNKNKENSKYGSETMSYKTPLLWANLPKEYKLPNSLSEFKSKIKTWKCDACGLSVMPTFPSEFRSYLNTPLRLIVSILKN